MSETDSVADSSPSTRSETDNVADSSPSTRSETDRVADSSPSTRSETDSVADSSPSTRSETVWPTAVPVRTKLYGNKQELEKTAIVISHTWIDGVV